MPFENIMFAAVCWLCSLIFGAIALWAFKRADPMHFWSGSTVRPEEIRDIPAYNRANGWMWSVYTACLVATGILSLLSITLGAILVAIISIPGTIGLIIVYNRIYKKYKNAAVRAGTNNSGSKTPKGVIVVIVIAITAILFGTGVVFYYGEKDPHVQIGDSTIQIKAIYGLTIDFSDIANIFLIDKSMKDIGIGTRTNGYGGTGGALKGNFKSKALGETLLFVRPNSSPTIRIERIDKKDVFLSFRIKEDTKELYQELVSTIDLPRE